MISIPEKLQKLGIIPFARESFSPASPSDILHLETRLRIKLPISYCTFLTRYGESTFSKDIVLENENATYCIGFLYGIDSLRAAIDSPPDDFPTYLIPIGEEGVGNFYGLGVTSQNYGQIYYWDHEIGLGPEAEQYLDVGVSIPQDVKLSCLFRLAESFDAFVDLLHDSA